MMAAWMLYGSLCALGLALAAATAERTLLGGRGPVRIVWALAVALSVLLPVAAIRFAPTAAPISISGNDNAEGASEAIIGTLPAESNAVIGSAELQQDAARWRPVLARMDQPLIIGWISLSLGVAFNFLGGIVTLAWMRRRWQRQSILGVPVFVSERTGPAVVGVMRPDIVLPLWALELESGQLQLLLRHEQEHRRAGDGRLLAAAQVALIAMPWNLALWWQVLRLRAAVELDCDSRVLQAADARTYGDLLLEVVRPRSVPRFLGATAFAERAAQLERRIRLLSRHRVRTSPAARALAAGIGLVALSVAWVAPHPTAPARTTAGSPAASRSSNAKPEATPMAPAANRGSVPGEPPAATDVELRGAPESMLRVDTSASSVARESGNARDSSSERLHVAAQCVPAGAQEGNPLVDSIFHRLFGGIDLTPDQAERACLTLVTLHLTQRVQDLTAGQVMLANRLERQALLARRDSALRSLLTNEADRAAFDARVARTGGGRRRSGGGGADSLAGGRRGGGNAVSPGLRRGGEGRRGGAPVPVRPDWTSPEFVSLMAEAAYHALMGGIPLNAEQEAAARELIVSTQRQLVALRPEFAPPVLRYDPVQGIVSMQAASAAELMALLSSDADRAILQSRIAIVPG
jgi:beta-lactamase regulating signal transducer with metallopeptidase domain